MPDIVGNGDDLGDHIATRSLKQIKGTDVASGDSITLQADGNTFDVTGTTTINHITSTNWIVGSVMILHFDASLQITNNAGGLSGAECNILLSGDVNYTTQSGDILTLLLHDSTNWQEISRNSSGSVSDASITNAKLANMAANTIKVRDANSSGVPSDKAVADTQILIGDGTGFTAASLSGDVTMANTGAVTVGTLNQNTTGSSASCTGNAGTVTTNANLTGIVTSTGNATAIANGAIAVGKISGFDTQVQTSRLDQFAVPTSAVAFNAQKITGLADGVNAQDGATKSQVDVASAGLDAKDSCRVATTANITLSGEQSIDGVTTTTDRVLVKNQTTGSQNGIYVSAVGAWARSTDADANAEVTSGLYTLITEGTTLAGQGFVLTTDDPITVGTTALTFSQFSGVGDLVGGTGITKTGNTIAVDASQTQVTSVGALNAGSITSGFGTINNGSSTITTTGATATGALTVTGVITGSTNVVLNAQGALRLNDSNNSNYAGFKAPADVTTSYDLIMPPATGVNGQVLKMSSTANTLEWGTAGGANIVQTFSNTTNTAYLGTASSFGTVGVGDRDIYIKMIDTNNEGVFTKIWKNGSATEVQIA
jgi:hypothetical protein